jgi:TonB-dependent receptor
MVTLLKKSDITIQDLLIPVIKKNKIKHKILKSENLEEVEMTQDYHIRFKLAYLIIPILLFLVFQPQTFAQSNSSNGRIRGVVTDTTTGKTLFGANVWLKGTSLGAATNADGKYQIDQVPPGTYDLMVRYIGYRDKTFPVTVRSGVVVQVDAALLSQAIETQNVTVTAQASGQKGAINQQIASNQIVNVVSADKIHQLPDDNAATALSRLPGVSIMNGDQVVIRGVEAKLNEILVNGVQLPSTDMTDRATGLGFISSNMLSGIEVIKTITPDMDANAIGGVVNLRLREAQRGWHFDILTQGNYNSQDRTTDNYKGWFSLSNRFLDDKLGVFLQGNIDRSDVGNQYAGLGYALLGQGDQSYGNATYQVQTASFEDDADLVLNNGGSLILDYKLPNGSIVLQNTLAHNNTNNKHYQNNLGFAGSPSITYTMFRQNFGKDLWVNSLQAENTFGDLNVKLGLSHSFSDQYTYIEYGDPGQNFAFNNPNSHPFGLDAQGHPITYANRLLSLNFDKVYNLWDHLDSTDAAGAEWSGWATMSTNNFEQHLYNASLDLSKPITFSRDITATFKAGGKFTRSQRTNEVQSLFSGTGESDTYAAVMHFFSYKTINSQAGHRLMYPDIMLKDPKRGTYYMSSEYNFQNGFQYEINTNIMDAFYRQAIKGWQPALKQNETYHNDFSGAEEFAAGYLMGTFDLFSRLTLIGGARYEFYNMKYNANFTYTTHNVYGDADRILPADLHTVDRNDNNVFPDVLVRYKINDWSDLRFGYTNGIARPDYLNIIPKTYWDGVNTWELGNTRLKPTTSTNFDLDLSFYNNQIGLFTVGGFYKELDNVQLFASIFYRNALLYNIPIPDSAGLADLGFSTPTAGQFVNTTVNNPNPAFIRGLEFDWQTNFWYLPEPFNSLVLDINYTKSTSRMDYRQINNVPTTAIDPVTHRQVVVFNTVDTIRTARLVHQADDVLNVAFGIDYKGLSGRISFNLQGNVINAVGNRPEADQFTGNIYRWDFQVQQQLPIEGLSISINGVNIFHNPIYTYQKFRLNLNAPVTENLVSVLYTPTIFQLNLRYGF